jgi:hypothetical protein
MHAFLRWFAQPRLPQDAINNPLVRADLPHRVSGALAIYAKGLGQVVFPWTLSGDYSFAAEPIPQRVISPLSVLGGALMAVPPIAAIVTWVAAVVRERRGRRAATLAIVSFVLLWVPCAYFPHSNIAVLLPTVRAERFWYLPVVGASFGIALALFRLAGLERRPPIAHVGWVLVGVFLGFQAVRARLHALDYTNDLAFWRATARAAPRSAKAHLNYGVMLGARRQLDARLVENRLAMEIAPQWPMAHVYYADTLCRLGRYDEAWPHYRRGFELGTNDRNLIALGLQCLWDGKALKKHEEDLLELAGRHPGSWLAYLGRDIVYNGEKHEGVDPQYRPRGYDEGPKNK